MMNLLLIALILFGSGTITILILIMTSIQFYDKIRLIFSDITRILGFIGKSVRKISVKSEYESTMNGIINEFNENFDHPLLPRCKLEWVKKGDEKKYLSNGKVIVCLSFDKNDHDLNFFNATINFIQTGLIPKTKPFLKKYVSKAIDLLSTKIILRDNRRQALQIFNQKFVDEDKETQEIYYNLEESELRGLYNSFFLPEAYFLGENLGDKTPSSEIEEETENFLNWFYELSHRDFGDKTNLKFVSQHIKIGVILVANLTTWDKFGTSAYTKWAEKYASEKFGGVYILARGKQRSIALNIADELIKSGGFDKINKKDVIKRKDKNGEDYIITCISLRPNYTTIKYNALEKIKNKFNLKEEISVIIETVYREGIVVNAFGEKITINNDKLSNTHFTDASKLFKEDQELLVKIIELDELNQKIILSNINTKTDPKVIIDSLLKTETFFDANITKIIIDKDNNQKGIFTRCKNPDINVFIPRSKATHSRFINLMDKYKINETIKIKLEEFNLDFGDYLGSVANITDPWDVVNIKKYSPGQILVVVIQEITEKYLTCEMEEGLECRLYYFEIAWEAIPNVIDNFKVLQRIKVIILSINEDKHQITVSIKQITKSPSEFLFEKIGYKIMNGKVTLINEGIGITLSINDSTVLGFVPIRELIWGYCKSINSYFKKDEEINAKVIEYDKKRDSLILSTKRVFRNDFEELKTSLVVKSIVKGKVIKNYDDNSRIEIYYNGLVGQAYIYYSEVSNIFYFKDGDLERYFNINEIMDFLIKKIDERNEIFELSRKEILEKNNANISYTETYKAYVTKIEKNKIYFYSKNYEGFIAKKNSKIQLGSEIIVRSICKSSYEFELV